VMLPGCIHGRLQTCFHIAPACGVLQAWM
jgi:hypothetical protein